MDFTTKVINRILKDYLSEKYDYKLLLQGLDNQETRRKVKVLGKEKINIVFVCHRAALWDALKSVCDACIEDENFNVTIVAIPNKKQDKKRGLAHEEYVSEGAEEYFKDYPCQVVNGYDYDKKKWFDLRELEPDYLFFQTPYDICRPPDYKSDVVALYTKLCYVHYGMPFMDGMIADESFPISFLKNTYYHFAEFEEMKEFYLNRVEENVVHKHKRVLLTGYPKLDANKIYAGTDNGTWNYTGADKKYRVMWTPRWNTQEGNSTFFELKDFMVDYFEKNTDFEFMFRPHPQAFSEWVSRGEMTKDEAKEYVNHYKKAPNMKLDREKEYLQNFYSSDVLITDESSIIPEYFLTGKPIIFTYKETHLNQFAKRISEGFYWAKDQKEVQEYIEQLKAGKDSKKESREKLIKEAFFLPEAGSGFEIKEHIKKDFFKS